MSARWPAELLRELEAERFAPLPPPPVPWDGGPDTPEAQEQRRRVLVDALAPRRRR